MGLDRALRSFDELHFAVAGAVQDFDFALLVAEDEDIAVAEVGFFHSFFQGHWTQGHGIARANDVDFGGIGFRGELVYHEGHRSLGTASVDGQDSSQPALDHSILGYSRRDFGDKVPLLLGVALLGPRTGAVL